MKEDLNGCIGLSAHLLNFAVVARECTQTGRKYMYGLFVLRKYYAMLAYLPSRVSTRRDGFALPPGFIGPLSTHKLPSAMTIITIIQILLDASLMTSRLCKFTIFPKTINQDRDTLDHPLQRFLKVMGMRDFFLASVINWQVPLPQQCFLELLWDSK